MFLYRKNIILVPSDYDGISLTKGLISLDCFDNKTECHLKCYNLFFNKPLLLGISINGNLHKVEVPNNKVQSFEFEFNNAIKSGDDISCVLISLNKAGYDIVLWGSTQINLGWKTTLEFMLRDELLQDSEKEISNINLQNNKAQSYNYNDTKKEEKYFKNNQNNGLRSDLNNKQQDIDDLYLDNFDSNANSVCNSQLDDGSYNTINNNFERKCNFKDSNEDAEIYTYEDEKINALIDKVIDMTENGEEQNAKRSVDDLNFYERINPQIEKMFKNNKEETILNEILPNSKFCRVEFDDGTGYYVFGIIYEDGFPKYLCYGLPAEKNSEPPKELSNLYQWLPIDATDENGEGYYIMYQDAKTGENISVEII